MLVFLPRSFLVFRPLRQFPPRGLHGLQRCALLDFRGLQGLSERSGRTGFRRLPFGLRRADHVLGRGRFGCSFLSEHRGSDQQHRERCGQEGPGQGA